LLELARAGDFRSSRRLVSGREKTDDTPRETLRGIERTRACPDQDVRDAASIRVTPICSIRSDRKWSTDTPATLTDLQRAAGN
jgi:hypothetical protein